VVDVTVQVLNLSINVLLGRSASIYGSLSRFAFHFNSSSNLIVNTVD